MATSQANRRLLHRFSASFKVTLSIAGGESGVVGSLADISPTGAKVTTALRLEAGKWCTVHVDPPSGSGLSQPIAIRAQCVRRSGDVLALSFGRDQLAETTVLFSALVDCGSADPSNPLGS